MREIAPKQIPIEIATAPCLSLGQEEASRGGTMRIVTRGMAIAVAALSLTGSALGAPVETVLASFNNTNGAYPWAGLISDPAGDLFGTTENGTVFEIAKTSTGYGTLTTLAYTNGGGILSTLISDAAGDLFGTTEFGGANN